MDHNRVFWFALCAIGVLGLGCGGGSGSSDSGTGQGPTAECLSCVAQNCDAQAKIAFGVSYQSGDYSGAACPRFFSCTSANPNSESACAENDGTACSTAFSALSTCLNSATCFKSMCKNGGGGGS
ncbi:MAG TPA: hypothetical protein VIJ25_15860, partial [Methylococcales bacterium]